VHSPSRGCSQHRIPCPSACVYWFMAASATAGTSLEWVKLKTDEVDAVPAGVRAVAADKSLVSGLDLVLSIWLPVRTTSSQRTKLLHRLWKAMLSVEGSIPGGFTRLRAKLDEVLTPVEALAGCSPTSGGSDWVDNAMGLQESPRKRWTSLVAEQLAEWTRAIAPTTSVFGDADDFDTRLAELKDIHAIENWPPKQRKSAKAKARGSGESGSRVLRERRELASARRDGSDAADQQSAGDNDESDGDSSSSVDTHTDQESAASAQPILQPFPDVHESVPSSESSSAASSPRSEASRPPREHSRRHRHGPRQPSETSLSEGESFAEKAVPVELLRWHIVMTPMPLRRKWPGAGKPDEIVKSADGTLARWPALEALFRLLQTTSIAASVPETAAVHAFLRAGTSPQAALLELTSHVAAMAELYAPSEPHAERLYKFTSALPAAPWAASIDHRIALDAQAWAQVLATFYAKRALVTAASWNAKAPAWALVADSIILFIWIWLHTAPSAPTKPTVPELHLITSLEARAALAQARAAADPQRALPAVATPTHDPLANLFERHAWLPASAMPANAARLVAASASKSVREIVRRHGCNTHEVDSWALDARDLVEGRGRSPKPPHADDRPDPKGRKRRHKRKHDRHGHVDHRNDSGQQVFHRGGAAQSSD
jgi:hypothetical protein